MNTPNMAMTISALLADGKGILAADESTATIGKRFEANKIISTIESRRRYREMLLATPSLSDCISGVILFDETFRQKFKNTLVPDYLAGLGIVPGIKVDLGLTCLAGFEGERLTQGLDGLRGRLFEYEKLGARFTKWRAVISIDRRLPTEACIEANTHALALFAALSQEAGLIPIVEPEVLMAGDHTSGRCEEILSETLSALFGELRAHRVELEYMLLKTAMVTSGIDASEHPSDSVLAVATLRCLARTVPAAVPGVVFLSGGQSSIVAAARLESICRLAPAPWKLSFSFGRALQNEALVAWRGYDSNIDQAQAALALNARNAAKSTTIGVGPKRRQPLLSTSSSVHA